MRIGLIDGIHLWPTRLLNQPAFPSCVPCFRLRLDLYLFIRWPIVACVPVGRIGSDATRAHSDPAFSGAIFVLLQKSALWRLPMSLVTLPTFTSGCTPRHKAPPLPSPNLHKYRNEYAGRVVVELAAFVTTSPRCISFLRLRRPNKAFKRGTRNQLGRLTRKIEVGDAETSQADIYLHLFGVIMTDNWVRNG